MNKKLFSVGLVLISSIIGVWISKNLEGKNYMCKNIEYYPVRWLLQDGCYHSPDILSDVPSIVSRNNHSLEVHNLTTSDGYILTLFRISNQDGKDRPVLFLQHGILQDSSYFVAIGKNSLAIGLADMGYEIWLPNIRGVEYSKKHTKLSDNEDEFWDFNLDTLANFDTREMLKYVARITRRGGSIIYIGHSMGAAISYIYSSEYPEEASTLLRGIISIAPAAFLERHSSFYGSYYIDYVFLKAHHVLLGKGLFKNTATIRQIMVNFCYTIPWFCRGIIHFFMGHTSELAHEDLPIFYSYWPASIAVQVFEHLYQFRQTGTFHKFDYGRTKNLELYGHHPAPKYNLSNIRIPTYIFYGKSDDIITEKMIKKHIRALGRTLKEAIKIPETGSVEFNHIDFLFSRNLKLLFLNKLTHVLKKLS